MESSKVRRTDSGNHSLRNHECQAIQTVAPSARVLLPCVRSSLSPHLALLPPWTMTDADHFPLATLGVLSILCKVEHAGPSTLLSEPSSSSHPSK